jgi:hypothetical protein
VIGSLRHLASMAGRALALLAVMLVALTPALPAHAHVERGAAPTLHVHAQGVTHHEHAASAAHDHASSDRDAPAPVPQHAADCCFVCHAPVVPTVAAVPMPRSVIRDTLRPTDRAAQPDALAERLPEPPRPSA